MGFVKCLKEFAKGIYETCDRNVCNLAIIIVVVVSSIVQFLLILIQFKCNPVKTYSFDIDKNTFEKVIRHLNTWQLFDSCTKQVREKF